MAGSIALSLTQRYDKSSHEPLDGGLLYFYAAGTTTPQSAYQDVSLTIPWPNPIELDSGGNVPQLFFADGYIKFRLANADGVTQIAADFVLVLGPSSGGGAAPSVDPTTIFDVGDLKFKYGTGVLTGFVRSNGRTIGSATSGATERANLDCQSLFEYLWGVDVNLSVSGGRGGSANADWTANKTIALPDWRGRVLAGLDDMGNSAAGRLTSAYFGTAATALGAAGGLESAALSLSQLPTGIQSVGNNTITVDSLVSVISGVAAISAVQSPGISVGFPSTPTFGSVISQRVNTITVTATNTGGASHNNAQPTMLATIYMKL